MAIRNLDNELLEPHGPIGHVNEMNERDAQEVEGFIPTRHELKQLYLYWADRRIDLDFTLFAVGDGYGISGSQSATLAYSGERLHWIGRLLGKDMSQRPWDSVESRFAKEGGQLWRAYKSGDNATRDRLLDEASKRVDAKCRKSKGGERRERQ